MNLKKIVNTLLFPHTAVMIILIPIATAFLVFSMVFLDTKSVVAVISYVVAFYTLTVWSLKLPQLICFFRNFREKNKYLSIWREDVRLRLNVTLYGTLIWNTAYAVFHLGLGIWHRTFWYYSLAGYYFILSVMRFFLVRYTSLHKPGEDVLQELRKYRGCGIAFLVMNIALALIIFFMVYWNRTFIHHEITTIAMAAYTFTSLTVAIVNVVRYRKLNSPICSASKAISLAAACVCVLTLEATMLTTFGKKTMDLATRRIMLGVSGGMVSVFIILMSVYMIIKSNKKIKLLITAEE